MKGAQEAAHIWGLENDADFWCNDFEVPTLVKERFSSVVVLWFMKTDLTLELWARQRCMQWQERGSMVGSCLMPGREHRCEGEANQGRLKNWLCEEGYTYTWVSEPYMRGSSSPLSSKDGSLLCSWMFPGCSEMICSFNFWRLAHLSLM